MNGWYRGWLTGEYGAIKNAPFPMGAVPNGYRGAVVGRYGFKHVEDAQRDGKTKEVPDLVWQQILEAINERRVAIRLYVPHPNISNADWDAMWRLLTWQDFLGESMERPVGKTFIDEIQRAIMHDGWVAGDIEYNLAFPERNPIGRFFCAPIDGDYDGTNWNVFEMQWELLESAGVGKELGVADHGYTIVPKRLEKPWYPETYAPRLNWSTNPEEILPCWEHVWELKTVLNHLEYLYPSLGFVMEEWTDTRYAYRDEPENPEDREAVIQAAITEAFGAVAPAKILNNIEYGMPLGEYEAGQSTDGSMITAQSTITWLKPADYTDWEFQATGESTYGSPIADDWHDLDDLTVKQSAASVGALYPDEFQGFAVQWDWLTTFARRKITFDYRSA
jgi:hypothetical protein